jgi:hypothetical protein
LKAGIIYLPLSRLLDQGIFQRLRKLSEQRVTVLRRFKLADGTAGIDSAHSGILPGGQR